ncbi:MAG: hypothetical protein VX340_12580, partial [Pseudomonadota bacterium]|nr:hypothetical protein [Pseudomonadota bacterium]
LGNRRGGWRRGERGRRGHVLGGDLVDQIFDAEKDAAAPIPGAPDLLRVRHDFLRVRVPNNVPDGDSSRGGRLEDGGLSGGPLPRVARAPSAGGTPA